MVAAITRTSVTNHPMRIPSPSPKVADHGASKTMRFRVLLLADIRQEVTALSNEKALDHEPPWRDQGFWRARQRHWKGRPK
jgi:hypothetical protein